MEALHISILSTSILSASLQADEIARGQTIGVGALEAGWLNPATAPECCLLVEPQGIVSARWPTSPCWVGRSRSWHRPSKATFPRACPATISNLV